MALILGIETSCDETAAAVYSSDTGIQSSYLFSQIELHKEFGGVVPEIASRSHLEKIGVITQTALDEAGVTLKDIDVIAVTSKPGLPGSLLVGLCFAKAVAWASEKKIIGNHLEGHIYANWLENKNKIIFPILCLIVSGGHTELVLMKDHLKYQVIGQTRDDAAGEAFDKVAKLLNIDYPGGPIISKLADNGNNQAYDFPRPMINSKDFDFSFSGLKTEILKLTKKHPNLDKQQINDICASFQKAVVDTLVFKTIKAAKEYRVKTIMLGGGVSANKCLRKNIEQKIQQEIPNCHFSILNSQFSSDNGAMIAATAYQYAKKNKFCNFKTITPEVNLSF